MVTNPRITEWPSPGTVRSEALPLYPVLKRLKSYRFNKGVGKTGGSLKMNLQFFANKSVIKMTAREATTAAKKLGYKETNYFSHGQPVFKKGNKYISPDVDVHSGGSWKMADSVKKLREKGNSNGNL